MKRWPILVSFLLFIALCVAGTFWSMQLFKPVVRPVSLPKPQVSMNIDPEAAISLFGGRATPVTAATNFQLRGVVVARNPLESVAILIADGKPAEAVRVNSEANPGVTVKEVHSQYVLLSDGGVVKRVELPADAPPSSKADLPGSLPGNAMVNTPIPLPQAQVSPVVPPNLPTPPNGSPQDGAIAQPAPGPSQMPLSTPPTSASSHLPRGGRAAPQLQ